MRKTRTSFAALFLALALPLTGFMLWMLHADAWRLGTASPVLNYDGAQYALAARELAEHGRLATTFALPLELTRHGRPPWPLAVVQPGLVLVEAALLRLAPKQIQVGGWNLAQLARPDQREWLALVFPFACYILIGLLLAILTSRLLRRHAAWLPEGRRLAAALTVGMAFYLDPEAQHFAAGGFTELPFTLGLLLACGALALGQAPRRPFLFGLVMGLAGTFRANMLWLAPVLALAALALAPRGRRLRVLALALAGFALPLAPWWFYKWRAFGSPAWDLTKFVVWDEVQGRTWFSLYHLPETPVLPSGPAALGLLAAKVARNLPGLLLATLTGVRALWIGALLLWLILAWSAGSSRRGTSAPAPSPAASAAAADAAGRRSLVVTVLAVLAVFGIGLATAALSIPWLRYVFPARVLLEAAGLLALWGLVARADLRGAGARRALHIGVGLLALGWGSWQSWQGNREARATSAERGVPGTLSMLQIAVLLNRDLPPGEPVMSNLGPTLAWVARRPVVHLASTPADVEACRHHLEFDTVVLVFRSAGHAWPGWSELVARPARAPDHPEWNVRRMRMWRTADGFDIIWLDLGPPGVRLAGDRPRLPEGPPSLPGAGSRGGPLHSGAPRVSRPAGLRVPAGAQPPAASLSSSAPSAAVPTAIRQARFTGTHSDRAPSVQ